MLKGLSLEVKKGELLIVIGPVGSGKTSLLLTLLGENYLFDDGDKGDIQIKKRARKAYVEQEPFVLSESVQDNITFGLPYNP